jgi:hypothetical protein
MQLHQNVDHVAKCQQGEFDNINWKSEKDSRMTNLDSGQRQTFI